MTKYKTTIMKWRDGKFYYNYRTGGASPLYKLRENAVKAATHAGYEVTNP